MKNAIKVIFGFVLVLVFAGCDPQLPSEITPKVFVEKTDSWSPVIKLKLKQPILIPVDRPDTDVYVIPMHSSLLANGKVMFLAHGRNQYTHGDLNSRFAFLFEPGEGAIEQTIEISPLNMPEEYSVDTFLGGCNTFMGDGNLFIAGGSRSQKDVYGAVIVEGLEYASIYNPFTGLWKLITKNMVGGIESVDPLVNRVGAFRWYPTCQLLPDGRMLVIGGMKYATDARDKINLSVEVYDKSADKFTLVSDENQTPSKIFNGDYTHSFQLPKDVVYDQLMFGWFGYPVFLSLIDSVNPKWTVDVDNPRPGTPNNDPDIKFVSRPNNGATSVMLPIRLPNKDNPDLNNWGYENGSVLIAGGDFSNGSYDGHDNKLDVYGPTNKWDKQLFLSARRYKPMSVILPNSEIVIIGGVNKNVFILGGGVERQVEYYNPKTKNISTLGADSGIIRGYHSVATLLPDGRVLVCGGRDQDHIGDNEKANCQYLSPGYISQTRPEITSLPSEIGYGGDFEIKYTHPDGLGVEEVVLMAPGCMTHSLDSCQRSIQLEIVSQKSGSLVVKGPVDGQTAPPGYYMVFLLDKNRTPSKSMIGEKVKMIKLS